MGKIEEQAEKYAQEAQEHLNKHVHSNIVPAYGPLAAAFSAGAAFAIEEAAKLIEVTKLSSWPTRVEIAAIIRKLSSVGGGV